MVVRDYEGQVLSTLRAQRNFAAPAYLGKTYVVLLATLHGKDIDLQQIILEGDALQVVKDINHFSTNWSNSRALIEDIQQTLLCFRQSFVLHEL